MRATRLARWRGRGPHSLRGDAGFTLMASFRRACTRSQGAAFRGTGVSCRGVKSRSGNLRVLGPALQALDRMR